MLILLLLSLLEGTDNLFHFLLILMFYVGYSTLICNLCRSKFNHFASICELSMMIIVTVSVERVSVVLSARPVTVQNSNT